MRGDLGQRAEEAHVRVIVLEHPETGETGLGLDGGEVVGLPLAVDELDQLVGRLGRGDQQGAARGQQLVDRLQSVPGPGLDTLAQRVVDGDGDVVVVGFVPGKMLLQFLFAVGDHGELLGRDAVAFGRIAVTPEGDADLPILLGGEDDAAADVLGQGFLKNAAVDDLHGTGAHSHAPLLEWWRSAAP